MADESSSGGDGTVAATTRRIVLHVDANDGRLLNATDEMTGEFVPYGIRKVNELERKKFSDSKKMIFEREKDRDEYPLLARFFGHFLCLADEIRVYAVGSAGRFPTACSYRFPSECKNTRLPMRFDYATCRLAVPVIIGVNDRPKAAEVVRRVARERRAELGHGHPGLTNEEKELVVLRAKAWDDVDDDVITTPYREDYAKDWFPVLREDGRVGLYVADNGTDAYVVVDNALPHFACDQIRILFSENPQKHAWGDWTRTAILDRAIELSGAVADAVASRVVEELSREGFVGKSQNTIEKTRVFVNRLVRLNSSEIRYDAGILRGSFFWSEHNRKPKALFRVGDGGYALVTKTGFERRDTEVFPANARDDDEMNALVDAIRIKQKGIVYDSPRFLREVTSVVDEHTL